MKKEIYSFTLDQCIRYTHSMVENYFIIKFKGYVSEMDFGVLVKYAERRAIGYEAEKETSYSISFRLCDKPLN